MNPARIEVDVGKARELHRLYREHRNVADERDIQIERVYREIGRGKKVIQAFESIRQAGTDSQGRPLLALIRADAQHCYFSAEGTQIKFAMDRGWSSHRSRQVVIPWPGMTYKRNDAKARVPLIPLHLRPGRTALPKYHILFEADWTGIPPDPMLLRRFGGDLWLVVAAWDLTPVERAVLMG